MALSLVVQGAAWAAPPSVNPPARPKPITPPAYALGPPAAIALVTDKDNGGSVTLPPDTTLVVRLHSILPQHNAWNLLPPNLPLRLNMPPHHDRAGDEFQFSPHYLPGKTQTFLLRFVYADSHLPTLSAARTWHIKVIIPPAFGEPRQAPLPVTPVPSH